jgi:hypothetical protein
MCGTTSSDKLNDFCGVQNRRKCPRLIFLLDEDTAIASVDLICLGHREGIGYFL